MTEVSIQPNTFAAQNNPLPGTSKGTQLQNELGKLMHEVLQHAGFHNPNEIVKMLGHTPQMGALAMTVAGIEALTKCAMGGGGGGLCVPGSNFSDVFMKPILEGLKPTIQKAIASALEHK